MATGRELENTFPSNADYNEAPQLSRLLQYIFVEEPGIQKVTWSLLY